MFYLQMSDVWSWTTQSVYFRSRFSVLKPGSSYAYKFRYAAYYKYRGMHIVISYCHVSMRAINQTLLWKSLNFRQGKRCLDFLTLVILNKAFHIGTPDEVFFCFLFKGCVFFFKKTNFNCPAPKRGIHFLIIDQRLW